MHWTRRNDEQGSSSPRPPPPHQRDFLHFEEITTRWNGNDVYGHMNNAVHYALFDSVVYPWLHDVGKQDAHRQAATIPPTSPIRTKSQPDSVERLGKTSGTYRIGLFSEREDSCAAEGLFVHVYADRTTHGPTRFRNARPLGRRAVRVLARPQPGPYQRRSGIDHDQKHDSAGCHLLRIAG
jgi:acyl-CoA thioester hydrolase